MAIAYRTHSSDEYYVSPTVSLAKLSGTAEGDVLLACFVMNYVLPTLDTLPTGWTIIAQDSLNTSPVGVLWVAKKIATASEPANYDFGFSNNFNGHASLVAYSGGEDVSIVGTAAWADPADSTSPYSADAASVTVPDNSSLLLFLGVASRDAYETFTWTEPSGFTERFEAGESWEYLSLTIAEKSVNSGSSGAVSGSCSGAGTARTLGLLIAIAPEGGASTIQGSGYADLPLVASLQMDTSPVSIPVGNTYNRVLTIRDQSGTGLRYLTSVPASTDTDVATVSQLAATDANGQATVRVTSVGTGTANVHAALDGVQSQPFTVTGVYVGPAGEITGVQMSVEPATVMISGSAQFAASVVGTGFFDPAITWSVQSGGGSISVAGLYTAPGSVGSAVIRAASSQVLTIYDEATIQIVDSPPPGPPTIDPVPNVSPRTLSGTAEPGASIDLLIDGATHGAVDVADGGGIWSCVLDSGTGTHTLQARQTTGTGTSVWSDEVTFTLGAVTSVVLRYRGRTLGDTAIDYWVISSADVVIAAGASVTDANGVLRLILPSEYAGQKVNVVLNNLGSDMSTVGRIQHQQVVIAQ